MPASSSATTLQRPEPAGTFEMVCSGKRYPIFTWRGSLRSIHPGLIIEPTRFEHQRRLSGSVVSCKVRGRETLLSTWIPGFVAGTGSQSGAST